VVIGFVVSCGLAMMAGSMVMMFGGLVMVFRSVFGHGLSSISNLK
jgi:hypothetical protein